MEIQLPCPTWCDGEHLRDSSMDPTHQSPLEPVPVITLEQSLDRDGALARRTNAVTFDVAAFQYFDDHETWIVIVEGESQQQRIEISLESAHRLMAALGGVLGTISG